jgi:hypothetical protein
VGRRRRARWRVEFEWDERETTSGPDGAFELVDLSSRMDYALLVRAAGRGEELQVARRSAPGTSVAHAPIVVRAGGALAGVVRRADGSAIPGASVIVEPFDRDGSGPVAGAGVTTTTVVTRRPPRLRRSPISDPVRPARAGPRGRAHGARPGPGAGAWRRSRRPRS